FPPAPYCTPLWRAIRDRGTRPSASAVLARGNRLHLDAERGRAPARGGGGLRGRLVFRACLGDGADNGGQVSIRGTKTTPRPRPSFNARRVGNVGIAAKTRCRSEVKGGLYRAAGGSLSAGILAM